MIELQQDPLSWTPERGRQPILVAVDFSQFSEKAFVWAVGTAKKLGLPLVVLHVVHDSGSSVGDYETPRRHHVHLIRIEEAASEMLSNFLRRMRRRHPEVIGDLEPLLVTGLPTTRIVEVATRIGASMIVVGSSGRTGLHRMWQGSNAEKIARISPIPVTIVKDSPARATS